MGLRGVRRADHVPGAMVLPDSSQPCSHSASLAVAPRSCWCCREYVQRATTCVMADRALAPVRLAGRLRLGKQQCSIYIADQKVPSSLQ